MNPYEKVIARDRDHLLELIEEAFEEEGKNWGSNFNGDISKWNVSKAANVGAMFENSALEKAGELPV